MRLIVLSYLLALCGSLHAEEPSKLETIDARLRQAMSLAKETNRESKVIEISGINDSVSRAVKRNDQALIERLLRDAEKAVGLDVGGLSMVGQPVSRLLYRQIKELDEIRDRMDQAMKRGEIEKVEAELLSMKNVLGPNVGVPDFRLKGETSKIFPIKPKDVADLFVRILDAEQKRLQPLMAGKPIAGMLARDVATIAQGCVDMRPAIQKHAPTQIEKLDRLIDGCSRTLMAMQAEKGYFKFPDLRGASIRYGEICQNMATEDLGYFSEGWVIVPLPRGGSFADVAEAGIALLKSGQVSKKIEWTRAGTLAVEWAQSQSPCSNFHENAYLVSLFVEAFRQTSDEKYRKHAVRFWKQGLSLAQVENGRWIDPENARTSNLMVIVRGGLDLHQILEEGELKKAVASQLSLGINSLMKESEQFGSPPVSAFAVRVLSRSQVVFGKSDPRIQQFLHESATLSHLRCVQKGVKAATPFPELAALMDIWK